MTFDDRLTQSLQKKEEKNLYRRRISRYQNIAAPRIKIDQKEYLSFCSNDYLGLASHPEVISAAKTALDNYGVGSGGSALVSGYTQLHKKLEESLAEFTQRSKALIFPSGFSANIGIISALVKRKDNLFMDKLSHASLIDGAKLSTAKLQRYPHLDIAHLQNSLSNLDKMSDGKADQLAWVITESLFSMDGDQAPLCQMAKLCTQHQSVLLIDDAHGIGLYGENGAGSVVAAGLSEQQVPILVGTFGKAFGVAGAFIAGSDALIESIIQSARSYIYTTATPPVLAGAILASLQLIQRENWRREKLFELIEYFQRKANSAGIPVSHQAKGPIQPILLGDSAKAIYASEQLKTHGLLIAAIRPPTVPDRTARLRITLSATHETDDIDRLLNSLALVLKTG